MEDNYNHIKKAFEEVLLSQDLKNNFQNIVNLKTQLQNYLNDLNEVSNELAKRINSQTRLVEGEPKASETTIRYNAVKEMQKDGYSLDHKLKQGYIYIDEIRESLTGEHISYQIGFTKGGKLYEGEIGLLDILNNSNLDVQTKSKAANTAKLRITKTPDLSQMTNIYQTVIDKVTTEASSIFSAVYNYLTGTQGRTPKVNEGNAYQTYKVIVNNRNGKNTPNKPPVTPDQIEKAFAAVKSNTVNFYRGGDIEDVQIKYFGGSAPSLVTTATIKRVLKNVIKLFDRIIQKSGANESIIKGFVKLFTVKEQKLYTEAEKQGRRVAEEQIRKRLSNIHITVNA